MKKSTSEICPCTSTHATISEKIIEIDNPSKFKWINIFNLIKKDIKNSYIIKCNLVKSTKNKLFFHVVYLDDFIGFIEEPFVPITETDGTSVSVEANISCLIIPTGVGASFGGYGGDANPIAKIFASGSKYLLTHPNVVNGAVLSDLPENIIYLEGFLLDQFLLGKIKLIPLRQNKIGIVFDKGIEEYRLEYEVNVLNALRAFYGCEIIGWTLTEKPIIIEPSINGFGFANGKIRNLEYIIESALKLKNAGATAIAICCLIPDSHLNKDYSLGIGVDPIGGVESIISHVVSSSTGLVSAHAPVLLTSEIIDYKKISLVAASEYIAQTFLPSVISGLRFAPQIRDAICDLRSELSVLNSHANLHNSVHCFSAPSRQNFLSEERVEENFSSVERQEKHKITSADWHQLSFTDISSIIVPYNAFGSAGVFYQNECFKNVVLVQQNNCCLSINPKHLSIEFKTVESYTELLDLSKGVTSGVDLGILKRPLDKIPKLG